MTHPTKPDWRRMPASAVAIREDGPEFVRLRAEDARRYADEMAKESERMQANTNRFADAADEAEADALRWEAAAATFANTWRTAPVDTPTPRAVTQDGPR